MSELALRLSGVSKMYKVFTSRRDRLVDALGMGRLPVFRTNPKLFWSLRDVDLEVAKGSRVGIIGRNGAGKSTLLKLITRSFAPTEGTIEVNGRIQALLEAGSGFHPEFTGYENITASLTYQGFTSSEIAVATKDIAEFTELGEFLAQPFKTYSLGMQARLAFATATSIKPDILIIDEVLGAGDAYFLSKSSDRMRRLVDESGATVLLVSHAMEQIMRYCETCVWLERGRIAKRGRAIDVVNAYEAFIREMEDRQIRGKNRARAAADVPGSEGVTQRLDVELVWSGPPKSRLGVSGIELVRDGTAVESLRVGDVQDSVLDFMAAVRLEGSRWSDPFRTEAGLHRELEVPAEASSVVGRAVFKAFGSFEAGEHTLRMKLRPMDAGRLTVRASLEGSSVFDGSVEEAPSEWKEEVFALGKLGGEAASGPSSRAGGAGRLLRWPSEGSLLIEHVKLEDAEGTARAVFTIGQPLVLRFVLRAQRKGVFNVVAGATLNRLDGVLVSNLISPELRVELEEGQHRGVSMTLPGVNLGDGRYVFSLSIFEKAVREDTRYDLIARGFEFQVSGNAQLKASAIFDHPSTWALDP